MLLKFILWISCNELWRYNHACMDWPSSSSCNCSMMNLCCCMGQHWPSWPHSWCTWSVDAKPFWWLLNPMSTSLHLHQCSLQLSHCIAMMMTIQGIDLPGSNHRCEESWIPLPWLMPWWETPRQGGEPLFFSSSKRTWWENCGGQELVLKEEIEENISNKTFTGCFVIFRLWLIGIFGDFTCLCGY